MLTAVGGNILTLILPAVQRFVTLIPAVVSLVTDQVVVNTFLVAAEELSVGTC